MQQIDLEPGAYRETGRQRIIRSILHKPVFMTISTVLGLWFAASLGLPQLAEGVFVIPDWGYIALALSWVVVPVFFIWAVLNDRDRTVSQGWSRQAPHPAQHLPVSADQATRRAELPAERAGPKSGEIGR